MEATKNYIQFGLEFWRQLRIIFGSVWNSEGDWELYSTLIQATILQETILHTPHSSKRGSFKTQATILHTHPRKISRWAHILLFVGKFVDFIFCLEIYGGALSCCCCLLLWEFWTSYNLMENHCVVMLIFFFFLGTFLNCWVVWYCEVWTMFMVYEALHCM